MSPLQGLHEALDILGANYLAHHPGAMLSEVSVLDLMQWSAEQLREAAGAEVTQAEHMSELLRFFLEATAQVSNKNIDGWRLSVGRHSPDTPQLEMTVEGFHNGRGFAFTPRCMCRLADNFIEAIKLASEHLCPAPADGKGGQLVRFRRRRHPNN